MTDQNQFSRRSLLKDGALGGGLAVSAGAVADSLDGQAEAVTLPMPTRVLGRTGRKVSILGMGGSMNWDNGIDPRLPEAIRHGVSYFDSAYSYAGGNSERALGRFFARFPAERSKVWVTSKSTRHEPEGYAALLAESLERLQAKSVDAYFLHGLSDPGAISKEMRITFERLQKQGKVTHFGFSCHNDNVAELLHVAAENPWIDIVMFRYNFREYGDKKLNLAMDACAKAGTALVAMKTQGSSVSFESRAQPYTGSGKWNKFQAVLKAVWEDERLSSAVSEMTTFDELKQNSVAAKDRTKLGALDRLELERFAAATSHMVCRGCETVCGAAAGAPVQIGTTLRYLMYHDSYGKLADARRLYGELPAEARDFDSANLKAATAACPYNVPVDRLVARALRVLT